MDWFKCLFCLESLKDTELVCAASCDHFIHEWCVATMKSIDDRRCKLCEKNTIVHSVFKEFDLERAIQIAGVPMIIHKVNEILHLIKSRENQSNDLRTNFEKMSEKFERLLIEHRALKFEKNEADKRLKKLEGEQEKAEEILKVV